MSSGPAGEPRPSRRGRIADGSCADACAMQAPLHVAGGSIDDTAHILGQEERHSIVKNGGHTRSQNPA
jgi:hypothetical protein